MRNTSAVVILVLAVTGFTIAQTQPAKPLKVATDQVERVEIIYFPERVLTRAALTPEALQRNYEYKLEIRDITGSVEWEKLLPLLRQTSLTPERRSYDHRTAVILFDTQGKRIASLYFDQFGTGGTINGESGRISSGIYRWAKTLLKGVPE